MQIASTPCAMSVSTSCTCAAASAWLGPTSHASCPVSWPNWVTPWRIRSNHAMPSTFTTVAISHFLPVALAVMSVGTLEASTAGSPAA